MENIDKSDNAPKFSSKDDLKAYLSEIEEKVLESEGSSMHCVAALNQLLRLPETADFLDDELKTQMKDLWLKLKSMGINLNDPPLLFGLPESFDKKEEDSA